MNAAAGRKRAKSSAKRTAKPSPNHQALAGPPRTSGESVQKATGRDRDEWFVLLDAWGATSREHREIAAWLANEHGVAGWWAQTLTVDYEQARGLRLPGGSRDGTFTVGATKTILVPVGRLFQALMDPKLRERWLPGVAMRERTSKPERSARFDWKEGPTRLIVDFTAKGQSKSQIALQHERLPNVNAAEKTKAYWRERLVALKALLED